jgi:hypothetical protein
MEVLLSPHQPPVNVIKLVINLSLSVCYSVNMIDSSPK